MRSSKALGLGAWAGLLLGCSAPAPVASHPTVPRRICGWDELGGPEAPPPIVIGGGKGSVGPGARVAILRLADEATMADLQAALRPAAGSLVRAKIAMDDRALLPLTLPSPPPPGPPVGPTETAIVGHRKITRGLAAPRDRVADLHVQGEAVTVFVENDKPGGRTMSTRALADYLRRVEPSVGVFTLGASAQTPWRHLRETILAAACYDRGPGEEPHEVILPLAME